MCKKIELFLFLILIVNAIVIIRIDAKSAPISESWITLTQEARSLWSNCGESQTYLSCLKETSLEVFDKMATSDIIPLTDGTRLVRYRYPIPKKNVKKSIEKRTTNLSNKKYPTDISWSQHVLAKIGEILQTHVLQIDLVSSEKNIGKARHRNRNQMLPMMVFGVTALGMVVVPLGFQFLAVLGGKALLLSKMALLLASINGLKRVATSGVHYGLYHTPSHAAYWDRDDHSQNHNHPRFNMVKYK